MKLVLFNDYVTGILKGNRVVDVSKEVADIPRVSPQTLMSGLIERFDQYRDALEKAAEDSDGVSVDQVRLRAPLPEPVRIVCMAVNYMEDGTRKLPADRNAFLKSPSAVIGPGDTIVLPESAVPVFHHEAELGLVVGKTATRVRAEDAMDYVFGYVNFIDFSARGVEPNGGSSFFWGKSWDTFAPLGPAIVTKDEIADVQNLSIKLWLNGELAQDLSTNDMGRSCAEVMEYVSLITTVKAGDVIATGTNHIGLTPVQGGDTIDMEIEGLGRLSLNVKDEWNRTWPKEPLSRMTGFEQAMRAGVRRS